jgi:hypothetical protein
MLGFVYLFLLFFVIFCIFVFIMCAGFLVSKFSGADRASAVLCVSAVVLVLSLGYLLTVS